VTAAAAIATPTSFLACRPLPGVIGASSFGSTIGASSEPTPIAKLAIVSLRS